MNGTSYGEGVGAATGWAWVEHLEAGGTEPWSEFATADRTAPARPGSLPGAAQLELARRVNLVAPGHPHPVVQQILRTGAPGRGRQEFLLRGAVVDSAFGPRPVDPRDVPARELVRLGAGVLAESLAAHWQPTPAKRSSRLKRCVPGPRLLTLNAHPLDTLLYDEWAARARAGRVKPWSEWVAGLAGADRLPPNLDLPKRADDWLARGRFRKVEVRAVPTPEPGTAPEAVSLVRRVTTLLGLLVPEQGCRDLGVDVLAPWLDRHPGVRLTVPAEHRRWLRARATRMADQMAAAGYPVRGDLSALAAFDESASEAPRPTRVLDMTVTVLRDGWELR